MAIRIASAGYIFMGVTVAIQGILQGLSEAISPLILSALRLTVFLFPTIYFLSLSSAARALVWLAFPIAELLTAIIAIIIYKKVIDSLVC